MVVRKTNWGKMPRLTVEFYDQHWNQLGSEGSSSVTCSLDELCLLLARQTLFYAGVEMDFEVIPGVWISTVENIAVNVGPIGSYGGPK
jgi:hypothetical protein